MAYAQSSVTLRTGVHSGYTRAVFDWPKAVPYEVDETIAGQLVISFDSVTSLKFGDTEHGANSNILGIEQISDAGEKLEVEFKIPENSDFRHFLVGSRLVVDVMNPSGARKTAAQKQPEENKNEEAEKVAVKPASKPEEKAAEKTEEKTEEKPVTITKSDAGAAVKARPVQKVERQVFPEADVADEGPAINEELLPELDPHVITMSVTESVGMAVFRRLGWLWIVLDEKNASVPPQIAGKQADSFGPFQRQELKGGVAFRTKLPPGAERMKIYGEGGGLVWRIIVSPKERDTKPVEMKRSFSRSDLSRGGTINWPFLMTTRILDVPDPSIGDVMKVVTVEQADQFAGLARRMVDFNTLESPVGLAIQPKVDDLKVSIDNGGVEITRMGGLAISRMKDVTRRRMREEVLEVSIADEPAEPGKEIRRIFDFDRWMMGGLQALEENQRILLSGMAVKDNNGRVQDLLTLAKMNVSNDRGQEALGFLDYAESELPDIGDSIEFRALRGASAALAGKFEMAFKDLFHPSLTDYTELDYWRAYTLASLEDWQQAVDMMPGDFTVLIGYPRRLLEKIGLKLAEVALRSGDVTTAEGILAVLQKEKETLRPWTIAGVEYLKGEAHRQSSEYELTKGRWEPLANGKDDLYRAKAGLALTILELSNGEISRADAIDRLEGLRYAWRGDEIESQINFMLGRMYLEEDRYLKGFTILREATSMSPDSDVGKEITSFMKSEFTDLLLNDTDLTPLDAVQVYEEFRELTPTGDDGNKLVQKLAERLVEADLLGRAAAILEHQVEYRLQGEERARVAIRLGAIHLLDKNARQAMKYLSGGRDIYAEILKGEERAAKLKEIDLLRARGLSQLNRTEEAIEMLNAFDPDPRVNRLRADIAWQAGLWEDAAEALQDLILDEALDLNRPLTSSQADLILNRAVALNLSGNRVALNNMRRRYESAMKKTARARLFDVVTRPRKTSILADRETIESIVNEVDLFAEFLESYKADAEAVSN